MKTKNLLTGFIVFVMVTAHSNAQQYDFKDGTFFYKILDASAKTVSLVPELTANRAIHGTTDIQACYSDEAHDAIYTASYVVNGNYYLLTIPGKASNAGVEYTVAEIGKSAFEGLVHFTVVSDIPNSISVIGDYAFARLANVASYKIPNSVTTIGNSAFYRNGKITSIEIPGSVLSIGDGAFYQCNNLITVSLSEGLQRVGSSAFRDDTKLTTINLPSTLTSLGALAFQYCSQLTSVAIPNGVTTIEQGTFKGCKILNTVVIGSGVTTIKDEAFFQCSALTSITSLPLTPPVVQGYLAFSGVPQKAPAQKIASQENTTGSVEAAATLYVPAGSVDAYKAANTWKNFVNIVSISTGLTSLEDIGVRIRISKGTLHISGLKINEAANNEILIYNLSGQLVQKQRIEDAEMSISVQAAGAYLVKVKNAAQKFVVR